MKGVTRKNKEEVFPATPTIMSVLNIEEEIKQRWLQNREALLLTKSTDETTYDERLRPYQNADVNFLIKLSKGKGVFNQQRVGKTPTTLVTMREKQQNKNIIIVPKSTIYQWKKEYTKWHGGEVMTLKDSWSKQKRKKAYQENKGTLIINYDKARIDETEILESINGKLDAIVLDEAHVLRNYRGMSSNASTPQTVKSINNIRKFATDAYALSGTPTPNKESDICGILAFLFPQLFKAFWPTVEYYFSIRTERNYMRGNEFRVIDGFQGPEKKQEMLEFLETFSIQRKRKDVMQWLPEVDYETISLEPTKKQLKWTRELKEFYETEHIMCENVLTTMIALRQIAHDPSVLNLESKNPKFEWIKDHIRDFPKKPIVIVSSFSSILRNLSAYLKDYKPKILTGDTSSSNRERIISAFQNREFNILIANIQVAKEGITLSKAEEIIFLDPSLTYTDNEQMKDRFLPTTQDEAYQKEGQKIIHLLLRKSIDIYINRSLNKKKAATDIVNNYLNHLRKE